MMRALLLVIMGLLSIGMLQGDGPQQERIKERVSVVNVEVVVRVFHKGQPVSGLKIEDFILEVNGRPSPIHGFYESIKKITGRGKQDDHGRLRKSRLFILIFNISDYTLDLKQGVKLFFAKVFRPGDRLMVVTNDFFLQDRLLLNLPAEEKKILKILTLEAEKYKYLLFNSRNTLKEFLRSFFDEWKSIPELRDSTILMYQNFYLQYIRDFKKYFLDINEEQYNQIANFIKEKRLETWVLNFYQIGGWYRPHLNSILESFLLTNEIRHELDVGHQLPVDRLARLFSGTGATFQTILMRPTKHFDISFDFWDEGTGIGGTQWQFDYMLLPTPSENLFKKVSLMTGGVLLNSNRVDHFIERVITTKDISYAMTYVPEKSGGRRDRIRIKVKRPGCRIYYNNQPVPIKPARDLSSKTESKPQVVLHQVMLSGADLHVKAAGFHLKNADSVIKAKARLRIRILNGHFKTFYDRFRDFEFNGELDQTIRFKDKMLKSGKYYMIVEVNDLQNTSSDMVIYDIKVAANGRIISVNG